MLLNHLTNEKRLTGDICIVRPLGHARRNQSLMLAHTYNNFRVLLARRGAMGLIVIYCIP